MTKRKKLFYAVLIVMIGIGSIAYPFFKEKEAIKIPVGFLNLSSTPFIYVTIKNEKYRLWLNLGIFHCIQLRKKAFENIEKQELAEKIITVDANGNRYKTEIFKISDVKAGSYQGDCKKSLLTNNSF